MSALFAAMSVAVRAIDDESGRDAARPASDGGYLERTDVHNGLTVLLAPPTVVNPDMQTAAPIGLNRATSLLHSGRIGRRGGIVGLRRAHVGARIASVRNAPCRVGVAIPCGSNRIPSPRHDGHHPFPKRNGSDGATPCSARRPLTFHALPAAPALQGNDHRPRRLRSIAGLRGRCARSERHRCLRGAGQKRRRTARRAGVQPSSRRSGRNAARRCHRASDATAYPQRLCLPHRAVACCVSPRAFDPVRGAAPRTSPPGASRMVRPPLRSARGAMPIERHGRAGMDAWRGDPARTGAPMQARPDVAAAGHALMRCGSRCRDRHVAAVPVHAMASWTARNPPWRAMHDACAVGRHGWHGRAMRQSGARQEGRERRRYGVVACI